MFSKQKSWLWKPKNPHSLEHLKYLYSVLGKHQTVTEQNRPLLVETLRSISEILIWGDQNDGSVFDFFLEKNMLSFFLRFMRQKYGRFICVQLLQTLNILFENISNETSVYYLLSNNHVNSIIVHKFDFSDEEVMAYYISFLKTLSLRLNKHTIHFFYNEHTNDFPLYTEAIKFFNHSETMVRIAVRTITLNVYKVLDKSMLRYIRDKTAAPYFSNLVWFIGNNVLDLDMCVRHDIDHNSKDRLSDLVAEHLDHLHYLNDILGLGIDALNEVLTDHLLNNLLLPLYVYSLTRHNKYELRRDERPRVQPVVSLFLLSQVFLIMHHKPLVRQLADIIFSGDVNIFNPEGQTPSPQTERRVRGFVKPSESLAKTLDKARGKGGRPQKRPNYRNSDEPETDVSHSAGNSTFYAVRKRSSKTEDEEQEDGSSFDEDRVSVSTDASGISEFYDAQSEGSSVVSASGSVTVAPSGERERKDSEVSEATEAKPSSETSSDVADSESLPPEGGGTAEEEDGLVFQNVTDDEKLLASQSVSPEEVTAGSVQEPISEETTEALHSEAGQVFSLDNRPYLSAVFKGLACENSDYRALFSLCLLYALSHNTGINQELLDTILMPTDQSRSKGHYNVMLLQAVIDVIIHSCENDSKVRLATLELTIKLLKSLVILDTQCFLQDGHLAAIEGAREEATLLLRNFYKSEEIFLDMFEDEYREMKTRPLNVEYLTMDASILLPPTGTPLTGIDFIKRLPCGEVERARRAIRVFFYVRDLSLTLRQEKESHLPLTKQEECVKLGDVLDLNNSDLIACTVITKDNKRERRFLVIDVLQLILVEPDSRKLGWGLVKFVGFLQDVEVTGDKEDSRSLHITIHKPSLNVHAKPLPLLSARFIFDDHIRCMAAKQRLSKGRLKARQRKMQMIARLLELPSHIVDSMYSPPTGSIGQSAVNLKPASQASIPGRSHQVKLRNKGEMVKKSVFASVDQTPPFAATTRSQSKLSGRSKARPGGVIRKSQQRGAVVVESPSPQAMRRESVEEAEEAQAGGSEVGTQSVAGESQGLEDISEKANRLVCGTRELFQGSRVTSRRDSSSPLRGLGRRGGSRSLSGGSAGSPSPTSDRSRASSRGSQSGRGRSESCPSPIENLLGNAASPVTRVGSADNVIVPETARVRRSSSRDSTCPKTLTPAQEPTLSLVSDVKAISERMNISGVVDSPKLLPPTETSNIADFAQGLSKVSTAKDSSGVTSSAARSLFPQSADEIDTDNEWHNTRHTTRSQSSAIDVQRSSQGSTSSMDVDNQSYRSAVGASSFPSGILSKSPPTLGETSTSADPARIARVTEGSATDELSRLAQGPRDEYASFQEGGAGQECIELSGNLAVGIVEEHAEENTG